MYWLLFLILGWVFQLVGYTDILGAWSQTAIMFGGMSIGACAGLVMGEFGVK